MQITNRLGLPEAIVEAVRNDDYERGKSDFTVTELLAPPRQAVLLAQNASELVEDASDRIWALMGQAVHSILERAEPSAIVEERLYALVAGETIGGKFDRLYLRDGLLQDYKVMSVWEIMNGLRPEREQQLNMLAFLADENDYDIATLEAVCIFRDWSKREAARNNEYPQQQVARVPVPFWRKEVQENFIFERMQMHRAARVELPECSEDERWAKPEKIAIMKQGRKSAVRLLNNVAEVQEYSEKTMKLSPQEFLKNHYVEVRPGENVRCDSYCAVAPFCDQYKALTQQTESE